MIHLLYIHSCTVPGSIYCFFLSPLAVNHAFCSVWLFTHHWLVFMLIGLWKWAEQWVETGWTHEFTSFWTYLYLSNSMPFPLQCQQIQVAFNPASTFVLTRSGLASFLNYSTVPLKSDSIRFSSVVENSTLLPKINPFLEGLHLLWILYL